MINVRQKVSSPYKEYILNYKITKICYFPFKYPNLPKCKKKI